MTPGVQRRAAGVIEDLVQRAREEWRYWLRHRGEPIGYQAHTVARLCTAHARMVRFALTGRHGSVAHERSQTGRLAC